MTIAFESPDQPEVIALITELDAYQDTLYPPESRHYLDLPSLNQSNVFFAVARDGEDRAIGCGAVVLYPEFDEIKRMYVSPRGRGQGVAGKLLILLESRAIEAGCQLLMLETGPYQHEALALYVWPVAQAAPEADDRRLSSVRTPSEQNYQRCDYYQYGECYSRWKTRDSCS
ncbi:MAG: GNAT family N-acetyltransferase [Steroidobacteraceae bacterium]|jgi:putative acetyltransferase